MKTNYVTRDNFGMYANSESGPGPALKGALPCRHHDAEPVASLERIGTPVSLIDECTDFSCG